MQKKIEASHMFMHAHSPTRDCARATEGGERTINNNNISIYLIYLSIYLSIYIHVHTHTHTHTPTHTHTNTEREGEKVSKERRAGRAERPPWRVIHLGVLRLSERDSSFSFPASSLHSPSFQSAGSPVQIVISTIFYDTALLVDSGELKWDEIKSRPEKSSSGARARVDRRRRTGVPSSSSSSMFRLRRAAVVGGLAAWESWGKWVCWVAVGRNFFGGCCVCLTYARVKLIKSMHVFNAIRIQVAEGRAGGNVPGQEEGRGEGLWVCL